MDCSPPGASVNGILQARMVEWISSLPSGYLPDPGIELKTLTSPVGRQGFYHQHHLGSPISVYTNFHN